MEHHRVLPFDPITVFPSPQSQNGIAVGEQGNQRFELRNPVSMDIPPYFARTVKVRRPRQFYRDKTYPVRPELGGFPILYLII